MPKVTLDEEETRRAAIAHHMEALEELAPVNPRDEGKNSRR